MKKYTLIFGLVVVLCCSSLAFACPHTITGSITIEDKDDDPNLGSCQLDVTASAYCTECASGITIPDGDIICTVGTATRVTGTSTWDISGSGDLGSGENGYKFEVSVDCSATPLIDEDEVLSDTYIAPGPAVELLSDALVACEECGEEDGECDDDSGEGNDGCEEVDVSFDPSIFSISGLTGGAIPIGGSITIKLVKPLSSMAPWELASTVVFSDGRVVRIRRKGSDRDGFPGWPMRPKDVGHWPLPGGEGCSSCSGGGSGGGRSHKFHRMEVKVASRQDNTLANKSSYIRTEGDNVSAYINLGGDWFSAHKQKGWSCVVYTDTIDSTPVKGFKVTKNNGDEYYYYEDGSTMPEEPKLKKVVLKTGEESTETIDYNYDGQELEYQEDDSGHKIEYHYNSTDGTLEQFKFHNGSTYETRTVDFVYNSDDKLEQIECSSCGTAQTYIHVPSNALDYDESTSENVPRRYHLSGIKDSSETQVAYYKYDSKDRITEHRLGSSTGSLVTEWIYADDETSGNTAEIIRRDYVDSTYFRVTVYDYSDNMSLESMKKYHSLQSGESLTGDTSTIEYSIVDDTTNNVWKSITKYPSGLELIRESIHDAQEDADGYLKRVLKDDGTTELVSQEYTYLKHTYGGIDKILKSTVERNNTGAVSNYSYDTNFKVEKVLGPTIDNASGVTGNIPARSDSRKEYDSLDRVKYSFRKNSNGNWAGREYIYNSSTGKLDSVKDGVVFALDGSGVVIVNSNDYSNAVVTDYTYNAFGDLTETCLKDSSNNKKNIKRFYYDSNGVKNAEATLLSEEVMSGETVTTEAQVISAVKYTYDDNGRLIIKSVVKSDTVFPEDDISPANDDDLMDDLAVSLTVDSTTHQVEGWPGLELTWVHTVTVYDTYGLRTAVVADATQETDSSRQHLKTEYVYNNQGEVKEVKSPSGKVVKTTRDGRGLVEKVETGYYSGSFVPKITVEYTYDVDGNLTSKTEPHPDGDGSEIKTVYTYDTFGRSKGIHTEKVP
ncbi:MAG: hypothetical protein FVQ82_16730 [Planctomycetes bacterium]|nr:hypothetical protein [Planctomycetota bacterium]